LLTFMKGCGIENVEHILLFEAEGDTEARKKYLELAYCLGKEF